MKKLTLSLLCAGLIATVAIAEDMCSASFQAGNYIQSEQCYIKQLKIERSWRNLFRLGASLENQQRYKDALIYLNEAEKKSSSLDEYALVYSYLSSVHSNLLHEDKNYFYSMKVLDIRLKQGNNNEIGSAYNNLGLYFKKQTQPEKALENYEKALNYSEESMKGVTYGNIARLDEDMGNTKKAEEMYHKAIANYEKFGKYGELGNTKCNLGIFYYEQSRYDEAKVLFNEVLVIAQRVGLKQTEATALEGLSLIEEIKKAKK
ncbi:MAG: tetratricopeptide repeat protein [Campylobacterales bacterium]|nr:tetratricopeptide repeat protein [Campylobacterales bacterium]